MTASWAIRFDSKLLASAAGLRFRQNVEILRAPDETWIRGSGEWEEIEQSARKIPGAICYRVLAGGRVLQLGKRIPEDALPTAGWSPLAAAVELRVPAPALPAQRPEQLEIRLVRTQSEDGAGALITTAQRWAEYFEVERVVPGAIHDFQDIVVLRRAPDDPVPAHESAGLQQQPILSSS